MTVCGIVAEYNPFHNGHKYHIEQTRLKGYSHIVAVMSGNFVQRGECAIMEKHLRAKAALENGVDLVLELPLPYAVSSANSFAYGAVDILNSLGCVDAVSFGSECGSIDSLEEIACANVDLQLKEFLTQGLSYPSAYQKAVECVCSEESAKILESPNNTLGIEYIRAISSLSSQITPITIKRTGVNHNSSQISGEFVSAEYIRQNVFDEKIGSYMPESSFSVLKNAVENGLAPADLKNAETAVLAFLRQTNSDYLKNIPDVSEGIENRLIDSLRKSVSLEELYTLTKTKRYTHSRIKRLVLSAFLGITFEYTQQEPPYIRVLGFNEKGREILKAAKETAKKPVVQLSSDFKKLDCFSQKLFAIECKSTDLFSLFTPAKNICGTEQTENVIVIK